MPADVILPASRRALLWILAASAAAAFGWFDVRQRARLDRGLSAHHTDFTVYTAAAEALADGGDPYEARSPRGWKYVYPPLLAVLARPLAGIASEDGAFVFYWISVAALAAAALALARGIGPRGPPAVALALLLAAPFLVQTFQRGQVAILLLAVQAGALLFLLRGRDVLAGVLLALGVALRLTPLLPAAMVGFACVRRLLRGEGRRAVAFPAGLLAGLVLWFAAVPVIALGPERAVEVTKRWIEVGREVYASKPGELADLSRDFGIEEWSYKNQGVRRVAGTIAARVTGAPVAPGGRPSFADGLGGVDAFAFAVALAVGVLAAVLAWRGMGERTAPGFRRLYAVGVLLPVFATRYAWPVHYALAVPFLAEAFAARRTTVVLAFAVGTVLFYAGHGAALRALPEGGVLLLGAAAAVALFLPGASEPESQRLSVEATESVLSTYRDLPGLLRIYRRLRLAGAGYEDLAPLLPTRGTIVDLGAGEGLLAHVLVLGSPDRRVIAVDHDAARVKRIRGSATGVPIEAVEASFTSYAMPRCEGVALVDVLHYLDAPAQEALLVRIHAALVPGGVLVMRDPDAGVRLRFLWTRLHERVFTALGITRARIGVYRSAAAWERALRAAGFASVRASPLARGSLYADRVLVAERAS